MIWLVWLLVAVIAVLGVFLLLKLRDYNEVCEENDELTGKLVEAGHAASRAGTVGAAAQAELDKTRDRLDATLDQLAQHVQRVKELESMVTYWKDQTDMARQETKRATAKVQ